jgi:sugar O-acyltransferase (sialic acid O-acetyltransferase NeuD family)|tara:strand:+ start:10065 stop:10718 length:654 start_codon:yes stop_codon:yes gene_type:complete
MGMNSVVIVGAGGFGREVLEIFKAQNQISMVWNILGFIDENEKLHGKETNGYPVLGGLEWLKAHNNTNLGCICAIGNCEIRKQVVERLQAMGIKFYNAIHPSVIMSEFVELGEDIVICAGVVLTVNIVLGNHVQINANCSIGHDAIIGNYCSLLPMVIVNGNDQLGEGVYVGTGANFIHEVSVGEWTTVGAGTVVIKDIPAKVVAVGVPAKVIKVKE